MTRVRNTAVIGAAGYGMNLVRNLERSSVLATVCEDAPEIRNQLAEKYPLAKRVSDPLEILADEAIVSVAIAGPMEERAALVRSALEAGKHVLVQRPLLCADGEAERLVEMAERDGLVLMVDHVLNYHPAVVALGKAIHEGVLGKVRAIYAERTHNARFRRFEHPIASHAPNDIAIILALAGSKPVAVTAVGGPFRGEVAEFGHTHLELANGIQAHTSVSWLHPFRGQRLVVVGAEQTAIFDETLPWREKLRLYRLESNLEIPSLEEAESRALEISGAEPLYTACEHFLDCIERGGRARTGGRFALDVIQTLNAAMRSLRDRSSRSELPRAAAPTEPRRTVPVLDHFVHPTAVIDDDVVIGRDSKIWHFSHVLSGSRLGERSNIGQNVMIGPEVTIGSGCKIQNNVSIYKGVRLEDDVFCGPSMAFTNVRVPRAEISQRDHFVETVVRKGVSIGANATVVCGVTLDRYALIGAGAVVTRDVPAHAMVFGNPAQFVDWVCCCGQRLSKKLVCRTCDRAYVKEGAGLVEREEASPSSSGTA